MGCRILHVEDDVADAALIRAWLQRGGLDMEILRVDQKAQLQEALTTQSWDLVLSDYHIPGLEGTDTLKLIRNLHPELPVIFVTGALGEERAVELLRQGATDYVLKQSPERLVHCVNRALQEASMRHDTQTWQRSAALALAIAENATHGLLALDQEGRCLFLNPAAQKLLGYSYELLQHQGLPLHALIHPEGCEGCPLLEALSLHRQTSGEEVFARPDGSSFPIAFTATPLLEGGRPVGTVIEIRDISEERRRRQLLQASEAHYKQAAEFEKAARAEAEQANRLKDDFIATVSHELRTPLTAMMGWMRLLRRDNLPEKHRQDGLEVLEDSTKMLAKLVEDLLDVSRILAGKLRLEVQPTDLAELVETKVKAFGPSAAVKGIQLRVHRQNSPRVMGDPNRLGQVVSNLVTNALKFTPSGGSVDVWVGESQGDAVVRITDTGQGIPAHALSRLFRRFGQVHGGSTRRFSGLGLGLSIVRDLVELHRGQVDASSPGEGRGASFTFRIPVLGQMAGAHETAS
jgi:PAS domain S-box-containing protein